MSSIETFGFVRSPFCESKAESMLKSACRKCPCRHNTGAEPLYVSQAVRQPHHPSLERT